MKPPKIEPVFGWVPIDSRGWMYLEYISRFKLISNLGRIDPQHAVGMFEVKITVLESKKRKRDEK